MTLFNEALKYGGAGNNPLYAGQNPDSSYYDYLNLIEMWASVFSTENISIRLFDEIKSNNQCLYKDFLNEIKIERPCGFLRPARKNTALSGYKQNLLLLLSQIQQSNGEHGQICSELRTHIINSRNNSPEIPQLQASREERTQFLNRFSQSNRQLSEKWLNGRAFGIDPAAVTELNQNQPMPASRPGKEVVEELLVEEIRLFLDSKLKEKIAHSHNSDQLQYCISAAIAISANLNTKKTNHLVQEIKIRCGSHTDTKRVTNCMFPG